MKRILDRLSEYWFAPAPPERLAILRIASGGFALWYLVTRYDMFMRMSGSGSSNFQPVGILSWMDQPVAQDTFYYFYLAVLGLNVAYILGVNFRVSGPLFALALLIFLSYRNSWSMIYHSRMALVLHVLVIGIVRSADALSVDTLFGKLKSHATSWIYGWPIRLICVLTMATYFLAGVAKMAGELALGWITGSAMRSQVAVDAIRKEMLGSEAAPLLEVIYPYTWLFFIMGAGAVILELGAPLFLYSKRLRAIWAILTWLMHWGIFLVMGIRFRYQMTGIIFFPFFDIEKVWFWVKRRIPIGMRVHERR